MALRPVIGFSNREDGESQKKKDSLLHSGEKPSRLYHDINPRFLPLDVPGFVFTMEVNHPVIDAQLVVDEFNLAIVFAKDGVVLEYVTLTEMRNGRDNT